MTAGHRPEQRKMATPLYVQGVGEGTQTAAWQAQIPIAVSTGDGSTSQLQIFEAPVVTGSGSELPGLLGLKSIKHKHGVIETANGKERLTFPGPGGYTITWAPGAVHLPLSNAPSGHMVIEVDHFDTLLAPRGGVPEPTMTLHSTIAPVEVATTTSTSASSSTLSSASPSTPSS